MSLMIKIINRDIPYLCLNKAPTNLFLLFFYIVVTSHLFLFLDVLFHLYLSHCLLYLIFFGIVQPYVFLQYCTLSKFNLFNTFDYFNFLNIFLLSIQKSLVNLHLILLSLAFYYAFCYRSIFLTPPIVLAIFASVSYKTYD